MKKIYVLFAIISLFVVQLSVVKAYDRDNNVNLDNEGFYHNLDDYSYSCGKGMVKEIPSSIIETVHIAYLVLQIVVPVILVIMGMITLIKAVTSSKEDEIKKAQMSFVKKLITGALVFFVFVIVKLIISFAATSDRTPKIIDCMDCFLNGKDNCVSSYLTKSSNTSTNKN